MVCYPEYRRIDLPWLKKIPVNWRLIRNKQFLVEKKGVVGDLSNRYTLLSLTLQGVIKRDLSKKKGKFPSSFDTYKIIAPGDFICCLFDMDETPRTVGLSEYNGMITGAYTVFCVHGINPEFLYYYYLSLDNKKALRALYTGLRKTIKTDTFLAMKLPVPPRCEQDKIVQLLEWKLSAINKLIHIKNIQIDELEELRISQIENVLSHNTCYLYNKPLKSVVYCNKESLSESTEDEYVFRYIDISSVDEKKGITHYEKMKFKDAPSRARRIVHKNDIIISTVRTYLRAVTRIEDDLDVIVSTGFAVLTPHSVNSKYLEYYLKSKEFCDEVIRQSVGVAYPAIDISKLMRINIRIPDYESQLSVVSQLDAYEKSINKTIDLFKDKIKYLQELKSVIISDVVTGKIDVRNVTIPEYEHVDDVMDNDSDNDDEAAEASEEEG